MSIDFDFTIENQEAFNQALDRLGNVVDDFRIPYSLISKDFYRSQRIIFGLKSRGLYAPLKNPDQKKKRVGFDYPLLVGKTENLSKSTLSGTHPNSILFIGRKELQIGTNVPYGKFHQRGTSKMPQRPFIFIDGGPSDRARGSNLYGRKERWLNIINDHILQILTGRVL